MRAVTALVSVLLVACCGVSRPECRPALTCATYRPLSLDVRTEPLRGVDLLQLDGKVVVRTVCVAAYDQLLGAQSFFLTQCGESVSTDLKAWVLVTLSEHVLSEAFAPAVVTVRGTLKSQEPLRNGVRLAGAEV